MVKLGAGTLVRQQEERVSVEAEDGDSVDLVCFRSVLHRFHNRLYNYGEGPY